MSVKVVRRGSKFDPKKIVGELKKSVLDTVRERVRRVRCDEHGRSPTAIRIAPLGNDRYDVTFDVCCEALREKARRAAGNRP